MLNKNKTYTFKELNNLYNMLNIEFKYFGQNNKGDLILYMLDKDKIIMFVSNNNGKDKKSYLDYTSNEMNNLKFKFDKEVEMQDYDINVIVNTSSCEKIPSGRYSIETLNDLTIENDDYKLSNSQVDQINGIDYLVIERNNNTTLFSGRYLFGNNGLLNDIEYNLLPQYEREKNEIAIDNIKAILEMLKSNNKESELMLN